MKITEYMKGRVLMLDGGMGSLLAERGLLGGGYPERLNVTHPEVIKEIHRSYLEAGSHVIYANTFGANTLHYGKDELFEVIKAGLDNARAATEGFDDRFVALDIGPTGKLLKPLGDLDFEDAVSIFAESIRIGAACGADLIVIETMSDSYETKAALLAAKENADLPIFVTLAFGDDGKLMSGASPEAMVALLEGMGADAIGVNCSKGPMQLREIVRRMLAAASVPVIFKPNAGLPVLKDGKTEYDITPDVFAAEVLNAVSDGVSIVGGCCGTTPQHIRELAKCVEGKKPLPIEKKNLTVVSSGAQEVTFGESPILIGERVNPTGKSKLKAALLSGDMDYILSEGVGQAERGAHILDVNVGMPELDETKMLSHVMCELQAVVSLPLQLDSASPEALGAALRRYNGKAMINSVSGKKQSMEAIFPLVKKYGGVVVALTLDENGIPADVEGRVNIARRILKTAEAYGIDKKDIVFDTLTMAASTDRMAPRVTLRAMERIRGELGCHTVLGVSNVSFGLPVRPMITSAFFAMALERGLSGAIMNPFSEDMMRIYYSYRALIGADEGFEDYISYASAQKNETKSAEPSSMTLADAIFKGMAGRAYELAKAALMDTPPLSLVQNEIVPALERVGAEYERGALYLPQLLGAAEAAGRASEAVKQALPAKADADGMTVVLATVKGDVHDIGKNIVKLLLANYGFSVVDLGKDVSMETVLEAVLEHKASLVCLSALMTTTVPAMEETVALVHEKAPYCRVMVGGAVLTADAAQNIGADVYAKDALSAVRYAERLKTEKSNI